jgi:hypothetical protein
MDSDDDNPPQPQPPPPEPKQEEDIPESEDPVGRFLPTGQTVSMAFWWATGTADDTDEKKDSILCKKRTIDLPVYQDKYDTIVPPRRYFYVPSGVIASTQNYDDFFISENTIAAHLLVRSEMISLKKQPITAAHVYDNSEAKREFGRQYRQRAIIWDNLSFNALKPNGDQITITTLTAEMRNASDPEFAKVRTWTKFIYTIRQKTAVK